MTRVTVSLMDGLCAKIAADAQAERDREDAWENRVKQPGTFEHRCTAIEANNTWKPQRLLSFAAAQDWFDGYKQAKRTAAEYILSARRCRIEGFRRRHAALALQRASAATRFAATEFVRVPA